MNHFIFCQSGDQSIMPTTSNLWSVDHKTRIYIYIYMQIYKYTLKKVIRLRIYVYRLSTVHISPQAVTQKMSLNRPAKGENNQNTFSHGSIFAYALSEMWQWKKKTISTRKSGHRGRSLRIFAFWVLSHIAFRIRSHIDAGVLFIRAFNWVRRCDRV